MRLRFGDHTFDPETKDLWRKGRTVTVSARARDLLAILLVNRPHPLPREDLRRLLWPESPAPDGSLAGLVLELRGALEERGTPEPIRKSTHPDGYAFVAEAAEDRRTITPGAGFRFRLMWDERELALSDGDNLIGRDLAADIVVDDPKVSRRHARISVAGERATLMDLGSRNGTLCNGRRVESPVTLADGDRVSVGRVHLVFRWSTAGDR